MCGISGQYCFKGSADKDLIIKMSEILKHRGPDADGTYFDSNVGLAHRRLSIIDLSESANQPMSNSDESVVVVYNGEIYNYVELKSQLMEMGHKFKTASDTEVIIHSYEQWGIDCLEKFNGMWALALYDKKKGLLYLTRDRFGIKPLYYTLIDNSILFASEIKALLAHPQVGINPNYAMVTNFLSNGMLDHTTLTMFSGVHQIPPSSCMVINKSETRIFKYSNVKVSSDIECSYLSDDIVIPSVKILLKKAIRRHRRSDVPIGTCLSGGIDSSTIVKLNNIDKQKTFSAIFYDKRFSESEYISYITCSPSIDSHYATPTSYDLIKDIDNLIYIQDEPFGSISIYAQYCVMKEAQGKVKVLLDGQGADELFAGYLAYQQVYIRELSNRHKYLRSLIELIGSIRQHFDFYIYAINQVNVRKNRKFLFPSYIGVGDDRYDGELSTVLQRELFSSNLPALLHYEDRNSMAFSLESRVPYLDKEFSEYVMSLPYCQKIRNGVSKYSLREAVKGIIPEKIRTRRDKMGFVTPEEVWMKHDLMDFVLDIMESESFRNRKFWFADRVHNDYLNFVAGKSEYSHEIWRIICVELWMRKFFDGRKTLYSEKS